MRMYILLKNDIPTEFCPVIAAHVSLGTYLEFKDDPLMQDWLKNSFKKVVCKITNEEFDFVKRYDRFRVFTESALEGKEVAIGFCPRKNTDWPKIFRHFPLWKE